MRPGLGLDAFFMGATMTLAERLAQPKAKVLACKFRSWFEKLDEKDQLATRAAMNNLAWTTPALTDEFRASGLECHSSTVGNHRLGLCQGCGKF